MATASSQSNDLTQEKMDSILKKHTRDLLRVIRIDPMLVASLVEHGAIPSDECENIQAIELPKEAKQYLLNILKSNLEYFLSFCIVLHDDMRRDDIVCDMFGLDVSDLKRQKENIEEKREKRRLEQEAKKRKKEEDKGKLKEIERQEKAQQTYKPSTIDQNMNDKKPLTYKDVVQLMTKHKKDFYDRFDPTNRVIAELKRLKVITPDTDNQLKAAGITPDEKKNTILECVQKRGVKPFLDFCHILCQDDILQDHLVTEVLGLDIGDIQRQRNQYPQ